MRHLPKHGEKELLHDLSTGDEGAFRILFERYSNLLGTHIFRVTGSYEVAEEVVQDVFLKIWMHREELTEVRDFRAYLFIMSRNHALNYLKKSAGILLSTADTDWTALENISFDHETSENDHYNLIDEAIDQLPPQQKKVYLLSRHERLKYQEIALRLNLSRETVKKYLQLATESITAYVRKGIVAVFFLFLQ